MNLDFRPKEQVQAVQATEPKVYYVPVRGPPGNPGHEGRQGDVGVGIKGDPGQNGSNGINGQHGFDGPTGPTGATGPDGVTGATGPTGPEGPPGVVSNDFSILTFKYKHPEMIGTRPSAIIPKGLDIASWGLSYESNPNKMVAAILVYASNGIHRIQISPGNGTVKAIYITYTGVESHEDIISAQSQEYYIDLPGDIPIKSGTQLQIHIKWN